MTVRIPSSVNGALDWLSRHRLRATGVIVAAAWATAVASESLPAGAAAAVVTVGLSVITAGTVQTRRLREDLAQAHYDNRALQAQLAECRTGNPTDPTVQLRTIGEAGERT
jgi:hypothetical protein